MVRGMNAYSTPGFRSLRLSGKRGGDQCGSKRSECGCLHKSVLPESGVVPGNSTCRRRFVPIIDVQVCRCVRIAELMVNRPTWTRIQDCV
jgi:hypothetical protein